jgi:RluA family pseudouridine synthase
MRRYVVLPGDPRAVGEIVARAGGDPNAIADGRVFVGRRRARRASDPVAPGDEVRVADPSPVEGRVELLSSDDALVVIDKPAGVSTIPDQGGAAGALSAIAARLVGAPVDALHATSRLDRLVSGVVVFARTAEAARALKDARAEGGYDRRYVALAARAPSPERGEWTAPIGRAPDPRRRRVGGRDAIDARTRFRVVAKTPSAALLAVAPVTGRTHQIRVHASHAGAPLLGDRAYGGPSRITLEGGRVVGLDRIALHCARVSIRAGRFEVDASAPIPRDLRELWGALGGEPEAWDMAVRCEL